MAQNTSDLWKTMWRTSGTRREYLFDIDGTIYNSDAEISHSVENGLFEDFGIGNAACSKLTISLLAGSIPRAATIKRFVRLVNQEQASEWIPAGVYFASGRSVDDDIWTIEAFDGMRKADKEWVPDQSLEFPLPMPEALTVIASEIGVEIDARTRLNPAYTIDYPATGTTYRQVLQWMAAAHGGNFIMSPSGELRLVLAGDMEPEKVTHDIGEDIVSVSNNGVMRPISRVTLKVDDENVITAGDDTGMELIADCPYATQEMVDTLLVGFSGYQYQMFSAEAANIDPAAELGDMVEVDGIRSVLAQISDDGSDYPDIAAPGEAETEDEYPSEGPLTRAFNRKLAQTRAEITRTAEQIRQEVMSEVDDLSSSITVELQSITEQVNGLDDAYAALHLEVGGITSKVSGLDGQFTLLEQTVKAFTYTGPDGKVMISNGNISLTGSITWSDLTADVQNRVGGVTEEIVHTLISEDLVESPTIRGANIYGGTFWDDKEVGQLVLSYDLFGYRQVPSLIFMRRDGTELFGAYDADIGTTITGLNGHAAMLIDSNVTYPKGKWNYENATVIGPKFSQVSRLTSDHTEFYIYVVFSGVGLYTPVYAAAMSRTYTFVGSSPNRSTDYPIYGMTISINGSGTVSVSNIYAIYPADVHRNAIDFSADSVTIYAR